MIPIPIASPAGIAKRATDWRYRSGRHGPGARREREQEGGDSDRDGRGDRGLPREQREGPGWDRNSHVDHGDEDGLGDEQPCDSLDVAQDLAPLGDHARHDAEVVANEHEVGDRARHLRARALGDREARLLQRRHVVDPVADHRNVATGAGEGLDDGALAVRRDPPDRRRGQDDVAERRRV